jgi:ABC-type bacteriocin/lantibiotic exporter with double-glycine peptidase domain
MTNMENIQLENSNDILKTVFKSIGKIYKEDKKAILNLIYYALLQATLVLSIPMSSAYVVNSIISHAEISIITLGIIVFLLFSIIFILQILQSYIIENFQQKIFLTTAIDLSLKATDSDLMNEEKEKVFIKYMNYFFDIISIQKFFPVLMLGGIGIVVQVIVSLLLLLLFNQILFYSGLIFFLLYIFIIFYIGRNAPQKAVARSDSKHNVIYSLQHIVEKEDSREEIIKNLDFQLETYVKARKSLFEVIIKQIGITYIAEGLVFVGFLFIGGFLVVNGELPVGDFIAAEIVIVSIIYALKSFIKQIDYIYDTMEGFHKLNKLSKKIGV